MGRQGRQARQAREARQARLRVQGLTVRNSRAHQCNAYACFLKHSLGDTKKHPMQHLKCGGIRAPAETLDGAFFINVSKQKNTMWSIYFCGALAFWVVLAFGDVSTYRIRLQDVKSNKALRLCMCCFMFVTFGIMADGVASHPRTTSGPPRDHLAGNQKQNTGF